MLSPSVRFDLFCFFMIYQLAVFNYGFIRLYQVQILGVFKPTLKTACNMQLEIFRDLLIFISKNTHGGIQFYMLLYAFLPVYIKII